MRATEILGLPLALACASLTLSAGGLLTPPSDLPDAIFNRPRILGGGRGNDLNRLAMVGDLVYVADGVAGLAIYNVTDPAKPRLVGAYPTDAAACFVDVTGTYASVITSSGAMTFDVSDPADPKPVNPASNVRDGIQTSIAARLVDVKTSHLDKADPEAERAFVAVVNNRAYVSRDAGVIELELHDWSLPSLPSVKKPEGGFEIIVMHAPLTNFSPTLLALTGQFEAGVFRLLLSGSPGQTVRVQRTSSLGGEWQDWQTITLGGATVDLPDEDAAGADQIFYRAISR